MVCDKQCWLHFCTAEIEHALVTISVPIQQYCFSTTQQDEQIALAVHV
jgi:hypothetical protein